MKILYVEDELAQNVERVLKLFGQTVLSAKQLAQLQALKDDEYGASNDDVRAILSRSGVLDVEISFPEALKRIEQSGNRYDIMIVDRQLTTDEGAYTLESLIQIVPEFSEDTLLSI